MTHIYIGKVESIFIKQKTDIGKKKNVGRGNVNTGKTDGSSIGLVEKKTKKKSMAELMMEEASSAVAIGAMTVAEGMNEDRHKDTEQQQQQQPCNQDNMIAPHEQGLGGLD